MNNLVDCFVEYVKSNYHKWDTVGRWRYFGDDCQDRKDVINSIVQDYHINNLPTEIADKLKLDDGGQANGISTFKIKDLFFIRCYGGDDFSDTMSNFEVKFQVGFGNILPAVKKQFGIDPRALPDHEDKINDKQLLTNYIDFNNRTYAAVYIGNGEFIVGSPNDSHTQMLNKYTNNSLSEEWGRTSAEEVQDKCEVDSVAFCHVINDCLFIDTDSEMVNCTLDEIVNAAKSKYSKVYEYKPNSFTTIRKAKRLLTKETIILQSLLHKRVHIRQL